MVPSYNPQLPWYVAVATGPSGEASSTLRLTPELKPSSTAQVVVFALP